MKHRRGKIFLVLVSAVLCRAFIYNVWSKKMLPEDNIETVKHWRYELSFSFSVSNTVQERTNENVLTLNYLAFVNSIKTFNVVHVVVRLLIHSHVLKLLLWRFIFLLLQQSSQETLQLLTNSLNIVNPHLHVYVLTLWSEKEDVTVTRYVTAVCIKQVISDVPLPALWKYFWTWPRLYPGHVLLRDALTGRKKKRYKAAKELWEIWNAWCPHLGGFFCLGFFFLHTSFREVTALCSYVNYFFASFKIF